MVDQAVVELIVGITALRELGLRGQGQRVALIDTGSTDPALRPWIDETVRIRAGSVSGRRHGDAMATIVAQAAPDIRFTMIDVSKPSGSVYREDIAAGAGIVAARTDLRIVNVSLEIKRVPSQCSDERPCSACRAIAALVAAGRLVFVAAGNFGPEGSACPAAAGHAVVIAATDGPRDTASTEGGESGTSVSAALLTAGCALLLQADPEATAGEVLDSVAATATRLSGDRAGSVGHGRAHFYRALRHLRHIRLGGVADERGAQRLVDGAGPALPSALAGSADPAPALATVERALALAPWSAELHGARGALLSRTDPGMALQEIAEAIRCDWAIAGLHRRLAHLLEDLGLPGAHVERRIADELDRNEAGLAARALWDGLGAANAEPSSPKPGSRPQAGAPPL